MVLLLMLLALAFALISGGGEFGVALGEDGSIAAVEFVVRGDVSDGAVESDGVVVGDEGVDGAAAVVVGERGLGAYGVGFEGLMPTLEFSVGLRVVRGGADVGHAGDADEFLEIAGDEPRAIVADDAGG